MNTRGVTLLELLVAATIIALLATTFTVVITGQIQRARIAAAHADIQTMEMALEAYKVDNLNYPPSGTGTSITDWTPAATQGNGYMQFCLIYGLRGPGGTSVGSPRWQGPYLNVKDVSLGGLDPADLLTDLSAAEIQILDPWGTPYVYVRASENTDGLDGYAQMGGTQRPAGDPFRVAGELYFNPTTFQIISFGPDKNSLAIPSRGLDDDDITNF